MPRIGVIGGGMAGLTAALKLALAKREMALASELQIVLMEAGDCWGGRVQELAPGQLHPSFLAPLAVGPEFLHGEKNNRVLELARATGQPLQVRSWPNYVWMGKEGRLFNQEQAESDKDFTFAMDCFESVAELSLSDVPHNKSLLQYLVEEGVPSRTIDLIDAMVANDYGTECSNIGLGETVKEQQSWSYGEEYLVPTNGWRPLVKAVVDQLEKYGVVMRLGWKCTKIEQRGLLVEVTSASEQAERFDRVVVALPLQVLCDEPTILDGVKSQANGDQEYALSHVCSGNAVKVFLLFHKRFFPDDFWDAVCADSFMPEVWVVENQGEDKNLVVLVGFVTGDRCERIMDSLKESDIVRLLLLQLDGMFGCEQCSHPATNSFTGTYAIKDWRTEDNVRSAYSHPSKGNPRMRKALEQPFGRIVLAGEYTHSGVNPCVHGAMETGERAAAQILHSCFVKASY